MMAVIQPHSDDVPRFAAGAVLKLIGEGVEVEMAMAIDDPHRVFGPAADHSAATYRGNTGAGFGNSAPGTRRGALSIWTKSRANPGTAS